MTESIQSLIKFRFSYDIVLTEIQERMFVNFCLSIIPVAYIVIKIATSHVSTNWENCQNKRLKNELNKVISP